MLLTLTTTHAPATDLGLLLHKNPDRVHSTDMSFGSVHVLYPEFWRACCRPERRIGSPSEVLHGATCSRESPLLNRHVGDGPPVESARPSGTRAPPGWRTCNDFGQDAARVQRVGRNMTSLLCLM